MFDLYKSFLKLFIFNKILWVLDCTIFFVEYEIKKMKFVNHENFRI